MKNRYKKMHGRKCPCENVYLKKGVNYYFNNNLFMFHPCYNGVKQKLRFINFLLKLLRVLRLLKFLSQMW